VKEGQTASPREKTGLRDKGYVLTSPFLGEKGRLHGLGSWRGRRKSQ